MRVPVTEVLIYFIIMISKVQDLLCILVWGDHSRETLSYWAGREAHLDMHVHTFPTASSKIQGRLLQTKGSRFGNKA